MLQNIILDMLLRNCKNEEKQITLHQVSSHLSLSSADEHIHCIYLMHFKLSLLMVLSTKTKGQNHQLLKTPIRFNVRLDRK